MSDTDNDSVKPYRARDLASGQEAADAVADVLKHAAERDEAAQQRTGPKPQPKWMLPVAMNLGLLSIYFVVAQPSWIVVNSLEPPPAAEVLQQTRNAMYMHGISRVQTFEQANGRLPASLEEAGAYALVGTVDYQVRPNGSFVLVTTVGEETIAFDSAAMTIEEFTGNMELPG